MFLDNYAKSSAPAALSEGMAFAQAGKTKNGNKKKATNAMLKKKLERARKRNQILRRTWTPSNAGREGTQPDSVPTEATTHQSPASQVKEACWTLSGSLKLSKSPLPSCRQPTRVMTLHRQTMINHTSSTSSSHSGRKSQGPPCSTKLESRSTLTFVRSSCWTIN